jgi:hypothetical protein
MSEEIKTTKTTSSMFGDKKIMITILAAAILIA